MIPWKEFFKFMLFWVADLCLCNPFLFTLKKRGYQMKTRFQKPKKNWNKVTLEIIPIEKSKRAVRRINAAIQKGVEHGL